MAEHDRTSLLACDGPQELFGDATGDAKALRRAYAALSKQFRPDDDPEAFEHLRRLYEAARDGLEGGLSVDRSPGEGQTQHPTAPTRPGFVRTTRIAERPEDLLELAIKNQDPRRALEVLLRSGHSLVESAPIETFRAIHLVFHRGRGVVAELDVDYLSRLLEDPRWRLEPGWMHQAESRALQLAALLRVERSRKLPPELCRAAWAVLEGEPAGLVDSARALSAVSGSLVPAEAVALFQELEAKEPMVAGLLGEWAWQIEELGTRTALKGPGQDRRNLAKRFPWLSEQGHFEYYFALSVALGVLVMAVMAPHIGRGQTPTLGAYCAMAPAGGLIATALWYGGLWLRYWGPWRPRAGDLDVLVAKARANGLFPIELTTAVHPAPNGSQEPFGGDHPLIMFASDPAFAWLVLTGRHVERLEANAKAAEAEEP